jgi:membrane protease YdiL (CAAX protease family)
VDLGKFELPTPWLQIIYDTVSARLGVVGRAGTGILRQDAVTLGELFRRLSDRGASCLSTAGLYFFSETRSQKLACLFLVAPTVGFCEELVYRSYVLNEIPHWWKGCPMAVSLFVSSLLFGLAHMAQGGGTVLQVFLMGALLACPVVYSGTLYPSIVIHTLYDAAVLAWVGPKLARRAKGSPPSPI